jgi:hypothetical protein
MATNGTKDWSELLDVALFEADRVHLRQRMEHATDAIHRRMEELLKDEHAGSISERVAPRNALATLAFQSMEPGAVARTSTVSSEATGG